MQRATCLSPEAHPALAQGRCSRPRRLLAASLSHRVHISQARPLLAPGRSVQVDLRRLSQFCFNPLQQLLADGCHLTRDPLPAIEAAGFTRVDARRFEVAGAGLIAPHVAGKAVL